MTILVCMLSVLFGLGGALGVSHLILTGQYSVATRVQRFGYLLIALPITLHAALLFPALLTLQTGVLYEAIATILGILLLTFGVAVTKARRGREYPETSEASTAQK